MNLLNILNISIIDYLDVIFSIIFLYKIFYILKTSMGLKIFYGLIIIVFCWQITKLLNMILISEILGSIFNMGFMYIIVIFQPELRRFLLTIGNNTIIKQVNKIFIRKSYFFNMEIETINSIVRSCMKFSKERTGALIAIQVNEPLEEFISGGDIADILITSSILENIFLRSSNLHDGAIVIIGNRIIKTRAGLPMPDRYIVPRMGFRHRAAIGLCDKTDAICIVVSEDTGNISYFKGKKQKLFINSIQLKDKLIKDLNKKSII